MQFLPPFDGLVGDDIKEAGPVNPAQADQQAKGRPRFVFIGPDGLHVQNDTEVRPMKLSIDLAVKILGELLLVTSSVLDPHRPLATLLATATAAMELRVGIQRDHEQPGDFTNVPALQRLLDSPDIKVEPLVPFTEFSKFDELLKNPHLGGFFIDQKMRGGELVNYDGIELAGHLRALHPKLPIYILTGYPNEDFTGTAYRVEDIVDKEDLEDRDSEKAQTLKARILRRLAVFGDVLDTREQRFHDLLVKSMKEPLTADEAKEMGLLETERMAPQHAAELQEAKGLEQAIAELKAKLQNENLNL